MIRLILPFPDHKLSPNARIDRREKARAIQTARSIGIGLAYDENLSDKSSGLEGRGLRLTLVFHPSTRRHYDLDNLIASMKPYIDGVFDVMKLDDRLITTIEAHRGYVVKNETPYTVFLLEVTHV